MYLSNADKAKYGSILKGLSTQQSLSNDQYPRTVIDSNNVLSNHPFDNFKSSTKKGNNNNNKNNRDKNDNPDEKEDEQEVPMSFAQLQGRCYCCGKPGHRSPDCQDKDKIPREEWAINKVEASHVQASENANTNNNSSTGSQLQGRAVMLLNGPESILDSIKPVQCKRAFFWTMSPAPRSSVTLIWLPTFDRPTKSLP
jgi:hypothetical protein